MHYLTAKFWDEYVVFQLRKYLCKAPDRVTTVEEMEAYLAEQSRRRPEELWPEPVVPRLEESWKQVGELGQATIHEFSFPSASSTPYPENNTVHGRYYAQPGDGKRPTVVVLSGWLTNGYTFYENTLITAVLEEGCHAMMMAMPYHMQRTPTGCYSGEYAVSSDLKRNVEGLRQGVSDARALIGWLQQRQAGPVGILGISLGGWVGSLLATCEPRLDFVILAEPAVDPANMLWGTSLCRYLRRNLSAAGFSREMVIQHCRLVQPATYKPVVPREHILILAGLYDQCARRAWVDQLWEKWGRPPIKRYPLGHMTLLNSPEVAEDIRSFIRQYQPTTGA